MMNQKLRKWCVLMVVTIMLSACANGTILSTVYGRFGPSSAKKFKSYANFNKLQTNQIDALAAQYHSWHRSTQLPRYAELLRLMVEDIDVSERSLSHDVAEQWWNTVRDYTDDMRLCNPLNVSADLLSGLSDLQVQQVASSMRADINEDEDEYRAESVEEKIARRFKEIRKWGNRSGVTFNKKQEQLLRETLENQISIGKKRYELRRIWIEQFIVMLEGRTQAGFKNEVSQHIDKIWNLTSTRFPEEWKKNEQLWTGFIKNYVNLQTDGQRAEFSSKALSTAATFDKLAVQKVEELPVCHKLSG